MPTSMPEPNIVGMIHVVNREGITPSETCDHPRVEVRNYDPVWRDGDVYCVDCGDRLRSYDAG